MNWADYVIIAVLALSVLIGLWRGLIAEVLALAVWVAAVWLAWLFGPRLAAAFVHTIDSPSIRIILAYALIFVVVLILGAILRFVVDKLVKGTGLAGSDRMLGMLFGLARGALLVTLVVFLLGFTSFTHDAWWHESRLLPTFQVAANWFGRQLPASVDRYLHAPPPHIRLPQAASAMSTGTRHPGVGAAPADATSAASQPAATVAPPTHSRDN